MKYKTLFVLVLATMLITPVFAFIHPPDEEPEPTCNTFGVKIEGSWCYGYDHAVIFEEPEDNFCDTFTVEVFAINVTDLYGFEYRLRWDTTYFALDDRVVAEVWPSQLVVVNETDSSWHKLVAVAKLPSTGANDPNGGILLCTYTFHIVNDVCWPQGMVKGTFWIDLHKMSDSCTKDLDPCNPIYACWKFIPKEPEVYIEPKEDINCVVGETVTYEVWVHNITKMKSIHFKLCWKGHSVDYHPSDTIQLAILNLTEVIINEEWLPKANRTTPDDDVYIYNNPLNFTSYVIVDIEMECTYPLINGTFKVCDLIFEKMDPWWCGRMPKYDIDEEFPHEMKPDNATTPLWFDSGYIDVMCPDKCNIYFGKIYGCADYSLEVESIYASRIAAGYVKAEWDHTIKHSPCTSAKLYVLDGRYDWAGIDIAVDMPLSSLWDLKFWEYIASYALTPNGWDVNVLLGIDADSDGDFEADVAAWHVGPGAHTLGVLKGDTFVQMDGALGMNPTTGVWTQINALTTAQWWTPDNTGTTFASFYGTFAGLKAFIPGDSLIPDTNARIKLIKFLIGGSINWQDETAYVDDIKINGVTYTLETCASYNEAKFTFMPVPGDLTGDGVVDIKDLTAIAGKYGLYWIPHPGTADKYWAAYYYDFNGDGIIDIFDIIVVSKNWERTCPF